MASGLPQAGGPRLQSLLPAVLPIVVLIGFVDHGIRLVTPSGFYFTPAGDTHG